MINYEIISSGSVGNCVKLTFANGVRLVVDIGLSFKVLKEHLKDVQIVFVSHHHL